MLLISCLRCTGAGRSWQKLAEAGMSRQLCVPVSAQSCTVHVLWLPYSCHGLWDTFCKCCVRHKSAPPEIMRCSRWDLLYLMLAAPRGCQSWRQSQVQLKKVYAQDCFQAASDLHLSWQQSVTGLSLLGAGHCCVCWWAVTWSQARSNGWRCQPRHWVPSVGRQGNPRRGSSIALGGIISSPQRHFPRPCLWIDLHCIIMSAFPGRYHCYTAASWSQLQCEHQLQVRPLPHNVWCTNITDFISEWRETNLVCSQSKHLWNDLG